MNDLIKKQLFDLRDEKYRAFHSKLIPNVEPDRVIGVRTPELRRFAKSIDAKTASEFIEQLPHYYYEENNVHAFLIEQIKSYDECISALNAFLPYVDNWATCDMMRPKVFKKHLPELIEQIKIWLNSADIYTVRFALEMLMVYFLDDGFKPEYLSLAASVKSNEYYIRMMVAWYFATALAKQYDESVKYIENKLLPPWVHNKTIQKARESFRISDEKKVYLKTLRIK